MKIKDDETKCAENKKTCETCVSRFLCPTRKKNNCCSGYNDEAVFRGLVKMISGDWYNESILDTIKELQNENNGDQNEKLR